MIWLTLDAFVFRYPPDCWAEFCCVASITSAINTFSNTETDTSCRISIISDNATFSKRCVSRFCLCIRLILWKQLFFRIAVKAILLCKNIFNFLKKIVSASTNDRFGCKKSWIFQILAFSVARNQRFPTFWFYRKHTEQRTQKIVWDTKNGFFYFCWIFLSHTGENTPNRHF